MRLTPRRAPLWPPRPSDRARRGTPTVRAAERELEVILNDEAEWVELLEIVRVDFGGGG